MDQHYGILLRIIMDGSKNQTMGEFHKKVKEINRKCSKRTLSKAPCLVALNIHLTLHLLLFGQLKQSM